MKTIEKTRVEGMGALPFEGGVAFRVWAPNADRVEVIGDFNEWDGESNAMEFEEGGRWYVEVESAAAGDKYKFRIYNGDQQLDRIDPYALAVTNSVGESIIHDSSFDWGDDDFQIAPFNELVIYEMHIGTYSRDKDDEPGTFADAINQFDHLKTLGINAIEIMPVAEFAGDLSWGYNPAHIFAIEQAYGGPDAFKQFVKSAHEAGFAVIMDVVFNHFGPSDLSIWQFDGWSENGGGGIYFYNDWRAKTPWGETRPDYGRGEVRQFIYDNAMMWLQDYHVDGLRYDMTAYIRKVDVMGASDIPEGYRLMEWINGDLAAKFPHAILIAEDLQGDGYLTRSTVEGGAGFSTQWDAHFVHPVRAVVQEINDDHRDMWAIQQALSFRYNLDAFGRVVYSESHDEIANGKARVPQEVNADDPDGYFAQKRSVLAAALTFTAPGLPMIMQGQELLEAGHFQDTEELDWDRASQFQGITRLYGDLIALRLNKQGETRGLCGQYVNVHHVNDSDKVVAFHRWDERGEGDDVVVVMNFRNQTWESYRVGFPAAGKWQLRFNSDWAGYSEEFGDHPNGDPDGEIEATLAERDGYPASADLSIGAYGVLIFSQSRQSVAGE